MRTPLHPAFDALPVQLWIAGRDGGLEYINPAAMAFFGGEMADLLGAQWADAVHPQDLLLAGPRWQQSLATAEPYEQLFRLRSGVDGRYYWYLARANPVRNAQGDVDYWVGINTELDGVVLAQQAARSEVFAKHVQSDLFEQMPLPMIVLSGVGLRIHRANAAARRYARLPQVEQRALADAFPQLLSLCNSGELSEVMLLGEGQRLGSILLEHTEQQQGRSYDVVCEPLHDAQRKVDGLTLTFLPA